MIILVLLGLAGGAIAGISPCVLPILPALLVGSGASDDRATPGRRRPLLIIAGLAVGFAAFTLIGTLLLDLLGLPSGVLRWTGLAVLVLVGLGLLIPRWGELLQRPFIRFPGWPRRPGGGGFLLGLSLGALYVPCAGPVLAVIALSGSTGRITGQVVLLTVAFAVGTALPLLVFALGGQHIGRRVRRFQHGAQRWRMAGGAVLVLLAVAMAFNLTDAVQRSVPGYTQALQDAVENAPAARRAIADAVDDSASGSLTASVPASRGNSGPAPSPVRTSSAPPAAVAPAASGESVPCRPGDDRLATCGPAAEPVGIAGWLNVGTSPPPTVAALRGSVVLVDFWTFSCINCQRTTPFLNSWYARYHDAGLQIIGVHTPEFAYERDKGAVASAIKAAGIRFPVGLDNDSSTWRAYRNSYWPAQYLVDGAGIVRHTQFGEGGYATSEALIRSMLRAARPGVALPPPLDPAVPA